jgi:wyosine [tRNA(Phe)-imidazoG37] synthetase (radical SAM superfamily)
MEKYVFGPVPSRRLGQSLGIDPVPLKTCNWNCVYCQLGRTNPFLTERKAYVDTRAILDQSRTALKNHQPGEIDWVTFVGSGETCLHAGIGDMVRAVKDMTDLPVAVITNGSLLDLAEAREELLAADAVLPSLDAGDAALFKRINRPHPSLTFEHHIHGLLQFREAYHGRLWIEVMLIKGVNDTEKALMEIADVMKRIHPDEIHILQPTRPPVEKWVSPPNNEGLIRAHAILGETSKTILPVEGIFDLGSEDNLIEAILGVITRHPMKESDLVKALARWPKVDIMKTLENLRQSGKAQVVVRYGIRFWSSSGARFPKETTEKD